MRIKILKYMVENNVTSFKTREEYENIINLVLPTITASEINEENFTVKTIKGEVLIDSWIVGFINAEGCFTHFQKGKIKVFTLEHTDLEILELIKKRFNFGPKIHYNNIRLGRKPTFTLAISSKKDILVITEFLNCTSIGLSGEKLKQFKNW